MVEAAAEIVQERGLAAATVEAVCARAGYTRGAFYSNFESMDELLFALFQQRAEVVAEHLSQRFDDVSPGAGAAGVEQVVAQVLQALPLNRQWYQVSTEMTALALRRPEAAVALQEHRGRLRQFLADQLTSALQRLGREPLASVQELTDAVMAMYEGTLAQAHLDGGDDAHPRQLRLLVLTVLAMTRPRHGAGQGDADE